MVNEMMSELKHYRCKVFFILNKYYLTKSSHKMNKKGFLKNYENTYYQNLMLIKIL